MADETPWKPERLTSPVVARKAVKFTSEEIEEARALGSALTHTELRWLATVDALRAELAACTPMLYKDPPRLRASICPHGFQTDGTCPRCAAARPLHLRAYPSPRCMACDAVLTLPELWTDDAREHQQSSRCCKFSDETLANAPNAFSAAGAEARRLVDRLSRCEHKRLQRMTMALGGLEVEVLVWCTDCGATAASLAAAADPRAWTVPERALEAKTLDRRELARAKKNE